MTGTTIFREDWVEILELGGNGVVTVIWVTRVLGAPVPKSLVIWVSPVGIPKTLTGNKMASRVDLSRTKSLLEEVSKIFVRS